MGNDVPLDMRLMAKDRDVIIIGGGDTGCDCIATSLRQVESSAFLFLYYLFYLFQKMSKQLAANSMFARNLNCCL